MIAARVGQSNSVENWSFSDIKKDHCGGTCSIQEAEPHPKAGVNE